MQEMEACWRSSVGLRGLALNRPVLHWLKTVVVSVREKVRMTCQVGTRKTCQSVRWEQWASLLKRRKRQDGIETEGPSNSLGTEPGGCPSPGQVVSGV